MASSSRTGHQSLYKEVIAETRKRGLEKIGLMSSYVWRDDPKRLTFVLARYKFAAKLLEGYDRVLEIGCGDGFGTRIIAQAVRHVTAVDFDLDLVESARSTASKDWPVEFLLHDILDNPVPGQFDAAFSLDMMQSIDVDQEDRFFDHLLASLTSSGVCIIGVPSLESQPYASKFNKLSSNYKEQPCFRQMMSRRFQNVFMFAMNDEVVHTGYSKMAHYNIALGCGPKHLGN